MEQNKVLVIGAGGRVGWPFCGYAAMKGFEVFAYDRDPEAFNRARYYEEENESPGEFLCTSDRGTYMKWMAEVDVIVIMIGTPVDAEGNPRVDGLTAIRNDIEECFLRTPRHALIVLRSTVSPGLTDIFRSELLNRLYINELPPSVVFAPERIAQGKTYVEMPKLPQLIGADTDEEFSLAEGFFSRLSPCSIRLTTKEAELGKLMTNMYRYVNFALANEFFMISERHNADYEKIRSSVNLDYPRMNLEKAGPNSAGPCLFKDGTFLVSHIPHTELIRSSFAINEGMPAWIYWELIEPLKFDKPKVAILGMTFKANNDDTRYSLSFKMKKILEMQGIDTVCYDPYLEEYSDTTRLYDCDVAIVMTPHDAFTHEFYMKLRPGSLVIDIWKKFPMSKDEMCVNGIGWR